MPALMTAKQARAPAELGTVCFFSGFPSLLREVALHQGEYLFRPAKRPTKEPSGPVLYERLAEGRVTSSRQRSGRTDRFTRRLFRTTTRTIEEARDARGGGCRAAKAGSPSAS